MNPVDYVCPASPFPPSRKPVRREIGYVYKWHHTTRGLLTRVTGLPAKEFQLQCKVVEVDWDLHRAETTSEPVLGVLALTISI